MHGLRKKATSNKTSTRPATAGGGAGPYHIKPHLSSTFIKPYYEGSKKFSRSLAKPYYEEPIFFQILGQTLYQTNPCLSNRVYNIFMSPRHFSNLNSRAAHRRHQDNVDLFVGFTAMIGLGRFFTNTTEESVYESSLSTPPCAVCDGTCKGHTNN